MKRLLVSLILIFSTCDHAIAASEVHNCWLRKDRVLICYKNSDESPTETKLTTQEYTQRNKLLKRMIVLLKKNQSITVKIRSIEKMRDKLDIDRMSLTFQKEMDQINGKYANSNNSEIETLKTKINTFNNKIAEYEIEISEQEILVKKIEDEMAKYHK